MKKILIIITSILLMLSLVACEEKNTNEKTPYIQDGYWFIDGVNTGVKSEGVDGKDGKDGIDGKDGKDGVDGKDGRSISKVEIIDGYLYITYSDATDKPVNIGKLQDECVHNWANSYTLKEADCIEAGYLIKQCAYCNVVTMESTSKTGHSWGEEIIVENASCVQQGIKKYICLTCKEEKEEFIEKSSHTYNGDDICDICSYVSNTTEGLEYTVSSDGTYYTLTGLGNITDTKLIIPHTYKGLPVKNINVSTKNYVRSLELPDTISKISSLSGFVELQSISIDKNNGYYTSLDGILYNKECTQFIHVPKKNSGVVTIPEGITTLSSHFNSREKITKIVLPQSLTTINKHAFICCFGLTSIYIPATVTLIDEGAFDRCYNLGTITFDGTKEQWNAIQKGYEYDRQTGAYTGWKYTVKCSDGNITISTLN